MKSVLRIGLVAALFLSIPAIAKASTIAVSAIGAAGDLRCGPGNPGGCISGFQFSISSGITVTALGVFDQVPAGLNETHQIGLWTNTGTLLASGTVTNADTLDSGFRFTNVTATFLATGTYRIGALFGSFVTPYDPYLGGAGAGITFAAPVTWLSDAQGTGFNMPGLVNYGCCTPGFIGPNFKFEAGDVSAQQAAAVPEPATLTLLGFGLAGCAAMARRRARA